MHGAFEYRSYTIRQQGAEYVASCDEEADGEIRSRDLTKLLRHIDEAWEAVGNMKGPRPFWIRQLERGGGSVNPERIGLIRKSAVGVAGAVLGVLLAYAVDAHHFVLDIDGDGRIALNDVHFVVNKIFTGRYDGHPMVINDDGDKYRVDIHPNPAPDIDFSMLSHRIDPSRRVN